MTITLSIHMTIIVTSVSLHDIDWDNDRKRNWDNECHNDCDNDCDNDYDCENDHYI